MGCAGIRLNKARERELKALEREDPEHKLRPAAIVEFAENPKTALHGVFEWDDTEAARLFRLEQAMTLIRVVYTKVESVGETTLKVRTYVSLPSDRQEGGGYRKLARVLDDEDMRKELLDCALDDIEAFLAKYNNLCELNGLLDEMRKLIKSRGKAKAA